MNQLLVGYGEKVITPPLGIDLCGYGFYLDRKAASVLDDLKARALFLKAGDRSLVLISADIIGLTVGDSDTIRAEVAAVHHLPMANVLLACTHTHSGPATQALPGLGEMDAAYMKKLRADLREATADAAADLREATLSLAEEAIEPLGYNRRKGNFSGVDPVLKAAIFRTGKEKTYLLNYACHAVVFGPKKHVSADWPGAVIRGIEKAGHRAVLFQGFCGDIDPVLQMNRWGEGTEDDLLTLADLVWRRLVKAENYAVPQAEVRLAAAERRVDIPLSIPIKRKIEREAAAFGKTYSKFPGAARFAQAWKALALESAPARRKSPNVTNVPLQALAIGGLRLIGLPAEVFCEYGLKLRKTFPSLMPVGFANGNIGYVPAGRDFRDETDYACYCAPMFYQLFPFTSDVERILLGESRALLKSL